MQFFSKSSLSFLFLLSSFFLALQVVEAEGLIKVRWVRLTVFIYIPSLHPLTYLIFPSFSNNHSLSERHNKPATCECPTTGGSASTGGSGGPSKGNGNGPSVSGGLQGIFQSGNCQTKNGFATSLDAVFDFFHKDVSSSLVSIARRLAWRPIIVIQLTSSPLLPTSLHSDLPSFRRDQVLLSC